jgi:hypothetical protein
MARKNPKLSLKRSSPVTVKRAGSAHPAYTIETVSTVTLPPGEGPLMSSTLIPAVRVCKQETNRANRSIEKIKAMTGVAHVPSPRAFPNLPIAKARKR